MIHDEILKISDDIEIVLMPSSDDLVTYYPLPQPKYELDLRLKNLHFTSNPGSVFLAAGKNKATKLELINMDLLTYMDENRTGTAVKNILQDNLETYLKQPFIMTNAEDEPFD